MVFNVFLISAGAMFAICDVKEYRKCVTAKGGPMVSQLFDVLHALCNLLLVKHENLQEVCGGETLVSLFMATLQFCDIISFEFFCFHFRR